MKLQNFLYNLPIKTKLIDNIIYTKKNNITYQLDLNTIQYKTPLDLKMAIYSEFFHLFPTVQYEFHFLKYTYNNLYIGKAVIDRVYILEGLFRLNINFEYFFIFVSKIRIADLLERIRHDSSFILNESYAVFIQEDSLKLIERDEISNHFFEYYKKVNPNITVSGNTIIAKPFKIKGVKYGNST